MPTKSPPLLCELHAHTRWSDGSLTVRELCDLYGRRGFDVLAVTDHAPRDARQIQAANFDAYFEQIEEEAKRARELYDAVVGYLRSSRPAFLVRLDEKPAEALAA